jgi:hypothetical protein
VFVQAAQNERQVYALSHIPLLWFKAYLCRE